MDATIQTQLSLHLSHLVRERDPYLASVGHFYVKEYIYQELSALGLVERHTFRILKKVSHSIHENLILHLPGTQLLPPILVGAHFDAVPGTPGADDNASGVAVLLELAKYFHDHPARHPIQLIGFDMEEYGLLGSQAYAQELKQNHQKIAMMISLEMLGYVDNRPHSQQYPSGLGFFYPSAGNFIALIGNLRAVPTMIKMTRHLREKGTPCEWLPVPLRGKILPDTRRSDHAAFWDQGYSAFMVTDTAHLRNPHYHQSSDTIETLNLEFLVSVFYGLVQGLQSF
jgi:Zn-dependent M28 family amino/carboxypeptidase